MAMQDEELLRFYLRDSNRSGGECFFSDEEILYLLEANTYVEGAAALGWLLKAGSSADSPTTITIGQMSETRGQVTESYNVSMKMHAYWDKKSDQLASDNGGASTTARWFEIRPDSGAVADLIDTAELVYRAWEENDLSRLA